LEELSSPAKYLSGSGSAILRHLYIWLRMLVIAMAVYAETAPVFSGAYLDEPLF